jgi:serine/threonine-protein kinase
MYLLGQGGMGEVHLARLTGAAGFEKLCIVKTILPQMMTDPQFVDRFHHEAKVLTHLTHSNIAQVYDMGDVDQTLYMAIEYVAGVDLSRVIDRVKGMGSLVPLPIAVMLGQQICEALGYAHRKIGADGAVLGIVHRDVSPQNVMVSYEGEVKVIDFGLAKSTARSKHTMPSTVLGKLGYMSPEQAKGEVVDHRSDIYSAGIVIWELIAGRPLFMGGTVGEMIAQMAFPKPVSLRTIRPEVSEVLDRTVLRALNADPALRYNRCDDFARALNELAVRESISVSSEDVGNYVRSMCPEEFAAERQLQSRLSQERKKGSSPGVQKPAPEIAGTAIRPSQATGRATDQFPGTLMRPPSGSQPQPMTAAQRALSGVLGPQTPIQPGDVRPPSQPQQQRPPSSPVQQSQVSEEIVLQRSKGPMIAVILALLVIAGGGVGGYFFVQKKEADSLLVPAPPSKVEEKTEPVVARAEVKEEPVKEEPAKEEPAKAEPAAEEPVKLERAEVKGDVLTVFRDKGNLWVRAGKKVKLKAGDEVKVVGPPIQGSPLRDVYGSGALMEINGSVARIDEGVVVPKGAVAFAVIEKGAVAAQKRRVAAATVSPAPAAANNEPAKAEPAKLEAKSEPEPAKVEVAKAEPVKAAPAKTEPVKTEPAKVEAAKTDQNAAATTAQQQPAKSDALVLKGHMELGGFRGVIVHNDTTFRWHGCEVRIGKKFYRWGASDVIEPGESDNIRRGDFEDDRRDPDQYMLQGYSLVRCKEAQGYVWFGKQPL